MLHELDSSSAISTFQTSNTQTLICFSATWCGPCQQSKPSFIKLAESLSQTLNVRFGIAYEHHLGQDLMNYNVRAFPTYCLYRGSSELGRVQGANLQGVEDLVKQHCEARDMFANSGAGHSLGCGSAVASSPANPADARQLRLARFQQQQLEENKKDENVVMVDVTEDENKNVAVMDVEDVNDAPCVVIDDSPPSEPTFDQELLDQLISAMGFTEIRAKKGLMNGGGTVEGAVEWLLQHQDDADIDDPIMVDESKSKSGTNTTATSYKCNECGKLLSSMANVELHSNKTGHTDFEESTEAVKALSPEEKAAKVEELKNILKAKRAAREDAEKVDHKEREKQRRFMGKEMSKTREEMEIEKRKRDAAQRKREKMDAQRERERIRAELEKDKRERAANKGKLSSKLGVDGYNPDAIQYDQGGNADEGSQPPIVKKVDSRSTRTKIDDSIKKVSQYRAGGDGGKCLKILLAYVKNVADSDEEKFKTIKTTNKAYVGKVKPFLGAKALLLAVGFASSDDGESLVLREDADKNLLIETKQKLEKALAAYSS